MKARQFLLYLLFSLSFSGYCQKNSWTISGIVVNEKKLVVQSAHVFVNNTSIGSTTNKTGNFQLNISDKFSQVELIVSLIGYKTIKRKINYSAEIQIFRFQLEVDDMLKKSMVSTQKDKDWKKIQDIFEGALIGNSKFAKDCKILNPAVVKLEYDKDKKIIATAKAPILINNAALGYKILFLMDKFESDGTTTHFSGFKFFEKANTSSINLKSKWDNNQKEVFNDSFRNFLISLMHNKLEENDFEVFKQTAVQTVHDGQTSIAKALKEGTLIRVDATEISTYDKDAESFLLQAEYPLIVFIKKRTQLTPVFTDYPYQYSEIVLPKAYAAFNENGWLRRPNDVVLKDYWSDKGLANQLPDDYNLDGIIKEPNEATINKLSKRQ